MWVYYTSVVYCIMNGKKLFDTGGIKKNVIRIYYKYLVCYSASHTYPLQWKLRNRRDYIVVYSAVEKYLVAF